MPKFQNISPNSLFWHFYSFTKLRRSKIYLSDAGLAWSRTSSIAWHVSFLRNKYGHVILPTYQPMMIYHYSWERKYTILELYLLKPYWHFSIFPKAFIFSIVLPSAKKTSVSLILSNSIYFSMVEYQFTSITKHHKVWNYISVIGSLAMLCSVWCSVLNYALYMCDFRCSSQDALSTASHILINKTISWIECSKNKIKLIFLCILTSKLTLTKYRNHRMMS